MICVFYFYKRMGTEPPTHYGKCLHTAPTGEHPHGRLRRSTEYNSDFVRKKQRDARIRSGWTSDRVGYLEKDTRYAHPCRAWTLVLLYSQTTFESQSSRYAGVSRARGSSQML